MIVPRRIVGDSKEYDPEGLGVIINDDKQYDVRIEEDQIDIEVQDVKKEVENLESDIGNIERSFVEELEEQQVEEFSALC